MGTPFSKVNFGAFEQALSSDLNRMTTLSSRELQEVLRNQTRPNELGSAGGIFKAVNTVRSAISGLDQLPTLASGAGFTMALGGGTGFIESGTGVGADDSNYQVVRWIDQTVTFGAPDGANPRIDLIVATPGVAQADPILRNVLVDPVARTVAQQNINKTQNPLATISVVPGTAAGTPVPPAIPANSIVLFEIAIPTAAANSTTFAPVRQAFRRSVGVGATEHAVVAGARLIWGDEGGGSASLGFGGDYDNRVIIDGEMIPFPDASVTTVQDSLNNPFGGAAGASDKPYYIYLCGGRNAPQNTGPSYSALRAPVMIVESLTAPDAAGRPSAAMSGGARGAIPVNSALFIGIGFVIHGTTNRKSCLMDGDWVRARSNSGGPVANAAAILGFFEPARTLANGGGYTTDTLATRPAGVDTVELGVNLLVGGVSSLFGVFDNNLVMPANYFVLTPAINTLYTAQRIVARLGAAPELKHSQTTDHTGWDFYVFAQGYKTNIRRYAA